KYTNVTIQRIEISSDVISRKGEASGDTEARLYQVCYRMLGNKHVVQRSIRRRVIQVPVELP
ncbi:hypothetical protein CF394_03390, partial [Tetzosporium hominis]